MKHSHYFKDVSTLEFIDVYRILNLYRVTDNAIGHAIKKLLCAVDRGAKSLDTDVQEAIDTLHRWQEMQIENMKAVEPDTKVKAWDQPDYCDSETYDEARIDAIGQNGNDGQHYKEGLLYHTCNHPRWHYYQSTHTKACTVCSHIEPWHGG